jgi:hypothetical protein
MCLSSITTRINEAEAKIVRGIWRRFVELKSTTALARELNQRGITTKAWTTVDENLMAALARAFF